MAWETWVQSQIESYQRLKKWYLMPPCLTLSIIRYISRVKWVNPGKGVVPSPTLWCCSYRKGSLRVTHDYSCQLYLLFLSNTNNLYVITWGESSWHNPNMLDCALIVSSFEFQSYYYILFRTNTLAKCMNSLIPQLRVN